MYGHDAFYLMKSYISPLGLQITIIHINIQSGAFAKFISFTDISLEKYPSNWPHLSVNFCSQELIILPEDYKFR